MSTPKKYDWANFINSQTKDLKPKEDQSEASDLKAVDEFLDRVSQTLREVRYDDPLQALHQQILMQAQKEMQQLQQFFEDLGGKVDMNRSDWFMYLDTAKRDEILKKTKRLNEISENLEKSQERVSKKELKQQAQPGFKNKPQLEREQELTLRLKQTLQAMNKISMQMNPKFNPRPGMGA